MLAAQTFRRFPAIGTLSSSTLRCGCFEIGREAAGRCELGPRLVVPADPGQCQRELVMSLSVVGTEPDRFAKPLDRRRHVVALQRLESGIHREDARLSIGL